MERILEELKKIIKENDKYSFEFKLFSWETDFLRFFNSEINYNITKKSISLMGTLEREKRKYSFSISNPTIEAIYNETRKGLEIVDKLPADPDFDSFEDNKELYEYKDFKRSMDKVSLDDKIKILKKLSETAEKHNFGIYGTFVSLAKDGYILNSTGLEKRYFVSPIMLDVKAVSNENMVTVIHSFGGNDLTHFDLELFNSQFEEKIINAKLPVVDVEPGDYEVILGPHAVSELLQYLMSGVYAHSLDSGSSFFEGKIDQKLFSEKVTLKSDPYNEKLITYPYTSDGHLAKPLTIIENGVFKNFIVDHYYSKKLNIEKNGSVGEKALVLGKGNKSLNDMIKETEKGLYIANLHYINFINQKVTSITGLTRDGTFLIENGKITKVVNNLRFTEKISAILENVIDVENMEHSRPVSENYEEFDIYTHLVPHIKTKKFQITSSTKTI